MNETEMEILHWMLNNQLERISPNDVQWVLNLETPGIQLLSI